MHKYQANQHGGSVAAIIVAAGSGSRAGGETPKQFQRIGGKELVRWSVEACAASPQVSRVVLVAPEGAVGALESELATYPEVTVVAGGDDRSGSVRAGLAVLRDDPPAMVLIHDGARPGLSAEIIGALVDALRDAEAAAPALPLADAVKRLSGDRLGTVEREGLVRIQTPQAFHYALIAAAYDDEAVSGVDDLSLVEGGARVQLVDGDPRLMKVTYPGDLEIVERMLLEQDVRAGTGFDVHAFADGDHVTLCGVEIAHGRALAGHSDADVGWHALTDALLGALALGDIGDHFPPGEPQWKGAASRVFLARAVELAVSRGFRISNVDVTLICEEPKIGPHRQAMRIATAEVLGIGVERVSIKATTTERLGFTGRGEGIAAQAAATLIGGA